ncbi:MAG: hypothetical protein ABJE66_04445 [Deltaproteobacteria bacterium]
MPDAEATWQIAGARVYRLPSSSSSAAAIGVAPKARAWKTFGEWVRAALDE